MSCVTRIWRLCQAGARERCAWQITTSVLVAGEETARGRASVCQCPQPLAKLRWKKLSNSTRSSVLHLRLNESTVLWYCGTVLSSVLRTPYSSTVLYCSSQLPRFAQSSVIPEFCRDIIRCCLSQVPLTPPPAKNSEQIPNAFPATFACLPSTILRVDRLQSRKLRSRITLNKEIRFSCHWIHSKDASRTVAVSLVIYPYS